MALRRPLKKVSRRFTREDAILLKACITGLVDLDEGRREPKTPLQVRFVRVCRGVATPITEHEKAYLRWRRKRPDIEEFLARNPLVPRPKPRVMASQAKRSRSLEHPRKLAALEEARKIEAGRKSD